eukprot:COSAG06_NODE_21467_length_755_cov_3.660061_1_plen_68_part_01
MLFWKSPEFCRLTRVFFVSVQSELILKILFEKSPKMSMPPAIPETHAAGPGELSELSEFGVHTPDTPP